LRRCGCVPVFSLSLAPLELKPDERLVRTQYDLPKTMAFHKQKSVDMCVRTLSLPSLARPACPDGFLVVDARAARSTCGGSRRSASELRRWRRANSGVL